ncbi:hypothetical protein KTT_54470 [Tengunoibacter tsumagoiensis]|uniref:Uncharacterized protein n=1 Tax=Tengunoibacter tsumagoiensis TaxID=2014871 RepID=A0A402A910_9CHLR|nr:hypothetical protein KTT_54470 [Tengunoibacter tsumagoiensis]
MKTTSLTLEFTLYGPYLKYRWQEQSGGPQYSIQMGTVPDGEGRPQEPDDAESSYTNL